MKAESTENGKKEDVSRVRDGVGGVGRKEQRNHWPVVFVCFFLEKKQVAGFKQMNDIWKQARKMKKAAN